MLMFLIVTVGCSKSNNAAPPTTYTVTFDSGGGTPTPTPITLTANAAAGTSFPTPPTNGSSTFGGWWTKTDGGGTEFTANTPFTADVTVYAYWPTNTVYTVTYYDGGTVLGAQHVIAPATSVGTILTEPTKSGSTFAGWWTAVGHGGTEFVAGTLVTADISVYVYWSTNPVYTVTYNSDGGTNVGAQHVTSPATNVGILPTPPTRTGYNFGGWYTAVGGGGIEFTASTTLYGSGTVYALWKNTVTFDSNGGTPTLTTVTIISPANTLSALPTQPTQTTSTFVGWFTLPVGGTEFTTTTPVTDNITVYAQWTLKPVYTVTYDSNGGDPVDPQHVVEGSAAGTLPVPTWSGYKFYGWKNLDDGTAFTASTVVTKDITVQAVWTSYSYTVTFNSQYATTPASPASVKVGSPATTVGALLWPTTPSRTGYTFAGWYTAVGGGGTEFKTSTKVTGNITVYAYWTINPVYTVTFDSQDATVAADPASILVVYPATTVGALPTEPTKLHSAFGGWWTQTGGAGGGGTEFTATTPVTADTTVYAYWGAYVSYIVTFDSQGGIPTPTPITLTDPATTVDPLPTTTRAGYIFGGWYTGTDYTTQFKATTPVKGNITVVAKWNSYSYYVTFNTQGGSAIYPTSVTVASPATTLGVLPTTTRSGFIFLGWWTSPGGTGFRYDENTTITKSVTLYAFWF